MAYDSSVGSSAPPAGSAPSGKPMSVPRSHGFHDRAQSLLLIQRVRSSGSTCDAPGGAAASASVSPTAKRPMATMVGSSPSSRYGTPKVSRASPLRRSMPMSPSTTPTARLSRPAVRDEPSSEAVATKASTMSAK